MSVSRFFPCIPKDGRNRGILAALAGNLLISFDAVFIRLSGTGGCNTAFLFGLYTAVSMSVFIRFTAPKGVAGTLQQGGKPLVLLGLLMLGSASAFVLSIKHTAVANTVIIMSSQPVLTAVLSWILLKEKTSGKLWAAIAAVICGIAVVVSGSLASGSLLGDGLALFTVACLSLSATLLRKYKEISRPAVVGTGGFFLAIAMFFPADPGSFTLNTWLIMAVMGLFTAPLGRVMNAMSTRYIPAAEMAMITLIIAVFAPLWSFLLFKEQPPAATLAGGAVILGSILTYLLTTREPS
ncbi:MAG: DMT family transporter [Desulfobacter sp.]